VTGSGWNLADVWERIADRIPDELAQMQGDRTTTWAEFDRRADGIAAALLAAGAVEQDKVAMYLHNAPEYLEATFGAFKAGLATVNTNYRYASDELVYLWDNADAVAVVFHGTFTDRCEEVRARVPRVTTWMWVDDGSGPCPDWAVPYETAAASATTRTAGPGAAAATTSCCSTPGAPPGCPRA
jgi:3-oxocholest-4-en-26-oate---CoA ligase